MDKRTLKNTKLLEDLFNTYFYNDIDRDNWLALRFPHWNKIINAVVGMESVTASAPLALINSSGISARQFAGVGVTQRLSGFFKLPHDYTEGTDIMISALWYPTTLDPGDVRWYLEFFSVALGSALTAFSTIQVITPTGLIAWQTIESLFPVISGTGYLINRIIPFQIYRMPGGLDTYNKTVGLLSVDLYYQSNTFGSRTQFIK